jgi:hypothetical protein
VDKDRVIHRQLFVSQGHLPNLSNHNGATESRRRKRRQTAGLFAFSSRSYAGYGGLSIILFITTPFLSMRVEADQDGRVATRRSLLWGFPMQYAITAAFLLAVVAGSFAAVILGGYGVAQLIAFAL